MKKKIFAVLYERLLVSDTFWPLQLSINWWVFTTAQLCRSCNGDRWVNRKQRFLNTHKILNNEPAVFKFGIVDYDGSLRLGKKFGENRCTGRTLGACVTYCTFVPFYAKLSRCMYHSLTPFFHWTPPQVKRLNRFWWLMAWTTRIDERKCLFVNWLNNSSILGVLSPKNPPKWPWIGISQPKMKTSNNFETAHDRQFSPM